ncbi:zinc-binding protein A33-like [Conger conger]|uniref:zinc-binding protein A33-like n=1 Tax=Conger conger TaxID=82655 RepID=UPI002A59B709|nr:zinc-binding protein A33-like [Conger conger]
MMAKASSIELSCSVCFGIFTDPVLMPCSHSFCTVCLQQGCGEKSPWECPVCKRVTSVGKQPRNLDLKNIVESYIKQKPESESEEKNEACCSLHGQKLLFFCMEDQEPICVMCQTSNNHIKHQLFPVEEATLDLKEKLKAALYPMKEKIERFIDAKQECEKTAEHIRSQAQYTEKQVKTQFEKLHQFLQDEEQARIAALREEEEQKSQMMKAQIENIARQISTLKDNITTIENTMDGKDINFLKTYKDTKQRTQCTLQDPELPLGSLIDVAKHLGNLKFRVWEKMLEMVQYTPVILDPNTAALWLFLSNGLTRVRDTERNPQIPDNPERFYPCVGVLGSEGFTSGKHSWEVDVGNKPSWDVGVVKESISRKGAIKCSPAEGFWVVALRKGEGYKAAGVSHLNLERKLQRIRVQLDVDRGEVSFIDPSDMSLIYTFKDLFTDKLFPYFNPDLYTDGNNPGALQICPERVSITVMSSQ